LSRHVHKMNRLYKKKRDVLVRELHKHFENISVIGTQTGLHLIVEFKGNLISEELIERILAKGVYLRSVRLYSLESEGHENQIVLGYGHLSEDAIIKGVQIIAQVIEENTQQRKS